MLDRFIEKGCWILSDDKIMQKILERYQPNYSKLIPTKFLLPSHKIFVGERSNRGAYCCWNRRRIDDRVDWSNKFDLWWEEKSWKVEFDED